MDNLAQSEVESQKVVDLLREEHQVLRRQIHTVETVLKEGIQDLSTVREVCQSLLQRFRQHMHREKPILAQYEDRLYSFERHSTLFEYADQRAVLKELEFLLAGGLPMSVKSIVWHLSLLFEELRDHMADQEEKIFPLVSEQ